MTEALARLGPPAPGENRVILPHEWRPRDHQKPLWRFMSGGGTRAVAVWHRRAGKDSTAINWTVTAAHQRVGLYWHLLPEAKQGRKVIWDGIDKQGRRIIDQAFPAAIRDGENSQEMQIRLKCGSVWQVVGSDNYNSLVGANPVGVVFSEFSIANPAAWDFIRPILMENGGWAIFIFTPRGRNHGWKLYEMARKNPGWFAELLGVDDTRLVTPDAINAERDAGMSDDMIQQEFFCSFDGSTVGSIYGQVMQRMRADGRIGKYPVDGRYPVNTFWDLGHSDGVAIVCHQRIGPWDRFVRGYSAWGKDLSHYVRWMKETGFMWGKHYLPHDAKNVTLAAANNPLGANAWDQLVQMGVPAADLRLVPRTPDLWASINAARTRCDTVQIDEEGCAGLIDALLSYRREWNETRQCFAEKPYHDWTSEYADAFRQWAQTDLDANGPGVMTMPKVTPSRLPPQRPSIAQRRAGY